MGGIYGAHATIITTAPKVTEAETCDYKQENMHCIITPISHINIPLHHTKWNPHSESRRWIAVETWPWTCGHSQCGFFFWQLLDDLWWPGCVVQTFSGVLEEDQSSLNVLYRGRGVTHFTTSTSSSREFTPIPSNWGNFLRVPKMREFTYHPINTWQTRASSTAQISHFLWWGF